MHAFQGRTVDTVIAAMEANHPNLTTQQKTLYVEISRARDRAELVTGDKESLRERLEVVTGERIAALEAVGTEKPAREMERGKSPEVGKQEGKLVGLEDGSSPSKDHQHDRARELKNLDRSMEL